MYIAKQKRAENMAEYILYLWQLEDLLRALQFSPEAIYSQLVQPQKSLDEQQQSEVFLWYMQLVTLLKEEGKTEHGHLEHTLHLIADLNNLHLQLLQLPVGEHYRKTWAPVSGELERLRNVLGKPASDIELCFRALYAVILYRLKGEQSEHATYINDVMTLISPLIAELAEMHRKVETGEIDLFKGSDGEL